MMPLVPTRRTRALSEQVVLSATGAWLTPLIGSHASTVHGLLSSRTSGVPAAHVPATVHTSMPLQTLLSEQEVPAAAGAWWMPVASQLSMVHGLPSSRTARAAGGQPPRPSHVSLPLQALPSEQE